MTDVDTRLPLEEFRDDVIDTAHAGRTVIDLAWIRLRIRKQLRKRFRLGVRPDDHDKRRLRGDRHRNEVAGLVPVKLPIKPRKHRVGGIGGYESVPVTS